MPSPTHRGRGLARDLAALIGSDAVSYEPAELLLASRDSSTWSMLQVRAGLTPFRPDVVVWPADAAQVAEVVRFAAERQLPVVTSGGRSGVSGGAVPVKGGIALQTQRLAGDVRIDLPDRLLETPAGIRGRRLSELLTAAGATLGHFPPNHAASTVGGWLATRSAGYAATRYGKIEDLALAVEAVDGTGEIVRTLDAPAAGPDLLQLLLGSEGTLAIFTAAKLRLWPAPSSRWLRGIRFASLDEGIAALRGLLRAGLRPFLARLHDPLQTLAQGTSFRLPRPLRGVLEGAGTEALRLALRTPLLLNALADALPKGAVLVLGFEGSGEDEVEDEGEAALALCEGLGGLDQGPEPAERALAALDAVDTRRETLLASGAWSDTLDVATTWNRAAAVRDAIRRAVAPHALVFGGPSHAYLEGCALELQCIGLAAPAEADPEEAVAAHQAALHAALGAAADAGATLSHGSGTGLARQLFLPREHGDGMRQLRALKKAFDPHGILNPGKLLL